MKEKIINYVRSGHPGLFIQTAEEARTEATLRDVAKGIGYGLYAWSVTKGLINTQDGGAMPAEEPITALEAIAELPEKTIIMLRDFHAFLQEGNPVLVRLLRETLSHAKTRAVTLVITGCRLAIPPELERELTVVDFALPGREELVSVIAAICEAADKSIPGGAQLDALVESATGLTTMEAENALALSVVETGNVDPGIVAREKANSLKKVGLLEIIENRETLDDIGGLDALKAWLLKRRDAFSVRAREYGLPSPKGLLMVGIPGCGKSLTAKAAANALGRPLLKLDAGRLFGGLVGESEGNLRSAIAVAEAVAPCVLWIDEIEKGFSHNGSSSDGGTSARVFGSFLSWMQEKQKPVFIVATANDVSALPPEFLRKGRWDELFAIDLPNTTELEAIWKIQIRRHGRQPGDYDTRQLASLCSGFTGAEVEAAFTAALFEAFEQGREPDMKDLKAALSETVPLSTLMAEQITNLRKWSKGRARPATQQVPDSKQRRISA
jgi:ATP-dependent 26S proteasome regulatory subunit